MTALFNNLGAFAPLLAQRVVPEPVYPDRNEFARDRDRVVHCKYFRRLEYKTQVFVNHLGDNYRTRLTHSIEVAQIARTVSRALGLNEDLTETLALAHDLGHPPFGHAGEKAIHEKMREYGGFDHNEQTLRIVTQLEERYPWCKGLNLTYATRTGLKKHSNLPDGQGHSLEAQIVDFCDEIAYNNHDVDDGLDSGLLTLEQLNSIEVWKKNYQEVAATYPQISRKVHVRFSIRNMINEMAQQLIYSIREKLTSHNLFSYEDVIRFPLTHNGANLVEYPALFEEQVKDLKKFLYQNLYRHEKVEKVNRWAIEMLYTIFDTLVKKPNLLPVEFRTLIESQGLHRSIADYIAGMTDRYAEQWYFSHCRKENK